MRNILYLIAIFGILSCKPEISADKTNKPIERNYKVRLSNHIGSEYYFCDTIITKTPDTFLMKNREDSLPFMEVKIPRNVLVRIYKNR